MKRCVCALCPQAMEGCFLHGQPAPIPTLCFFKLNSCETPSGPSIACPSNHVIKDEMSLECVHLESEAEDVHKQSASNIVTVWRRSGSWCLCSVYCRCMSVLALSCWEAIKAWPSNPEERNNNHSSIKNN